MPDPDVTTDRPPKRTWLRRVRTVALCLIAGAIINVLVAWGIYLFPSDMMTVKRPPDVIPDWQYWKLTGLDPISNMPLWPAREAGWGYDLETKMPPIRTSGYPVVWRLSVGVPMRSFTSFSVHDSGAFEGFSLPVRPLPIGFAVNTITYAAVLWLLCAAPNFCRGWILERNERRRGLCPSCAYDLRGAKHEVCPECGEQVA